jgi:hypothetical protein
VLKPRKAICSLPVNRGGCQAKLRRFYFDSADETCKLMVFGGCQGDYVQKIKKIIRRGDLSLQRRISNRFWEESDQWPMTRR